MSTGPITIFDKSALQALSLDEAVLFGQFYRINLTPIFFVETLADLEKKVQQGQTPEQVVGTIAKKTANLTTDPSVHHQRLLLKNLLGGEVVMDGRVHVQGGRPVRTGDKKGVVYEQSPETEAMRRWQQRRFLEIERDMAREWRARLAGQRLAKMELSEFFEDGKRPRSLSEVKAYADRFVGRGREGFLAALNVLGVPSTFRDQIFERWLHHGARPIAEYAPYAAYVASVLVFFHLAVAADFISAERASNAADIAYLFYLPFCMVFTSDDHLHVKTVPLFMRPNQEFVLGADLKADLRKLDVYFSAMPTQVLQRGVMYFDPPNDDDYLTTKLWRRFLPGWNPDRPREVKISPEKEAELIRELTAAAAAPAEPDTHSEDTAFVMIKRMIPERIGKWQILPAGMTERSSGPADPAPVLDTEDGRSDSGSE